MSEEEGLQCAKDILAHCSTPTVCTSLLTAHSWDPVLAPLVKHPRMVPRKASENKKRADSAERKVSSFFPSRKAGVQNQIEVEEVIEKQDNQNLDSGDRASTVSKKPRKSKQ